MSTRENVKKNIIEGLRNALEDAIASGELTLSGETPQVTLEVPRERDRGDFASPIAMQLARLAHRNPRDIAQILVNNLERENLPAGEIEIAGPGFINFSLEPLWLAPVIGEILTEGRNYGKNNKGEGLRVNVEFVSANPTGPMHIGNARGGAIGDVLAALFDYNGFETEREFYVNDAGNQIEKFGDSLLTRYKELSGEDIVFPEDLYQGADITERVKEYLNLLPEDQKLVFTELSDQEKKERLIDYALNKNLGQMRADLENYGVNFNTWFSEKTLHDSGEVKEALEKLNEAGCVYEKEGALWFKSTDFGLSKDDVLVRANGIPTYFLADIAYHLNKFASRDFDYGIDIWGADHYGHIARLAAALKAAGEGDKLTVVTMQLVQLKENDELVRLSKRKGNIISLSDLTSRIGKDAARFFFNLRSPDSQFELDLNLALEESSENPVFYVQYAHARIASILRKIGEVSEEFNPELLRTPEELALIEHLSRFPEEIIIARESLDPSRITHYGIDLASAFHSFYNACRVDVEDLDLKAARVALIKATGQVLRNIADILGIAAPESM